MGGDVKLFGFRLVDASSVLLFIMSVLMLLIGFFYAYETFMIYDAIGEIPWMYLIVSIVLIVLSIYILIKTLQHKKKGPRR